ncbi:MAG: DUF664 domain-containing protein [Anaerolineales bacterium]|nr:DUF664 domain-containing protein [Anaerolineales bacterium]
MEFELEKAIVVLQTTPAILQAWLRHLPHEWVTATDDEDTWSAFDIVGHLIHGEKTDWIPRAEIILSDRETKKFEPFDRFAMLKESQGRTMQELLDTFMHLRHESINHLRALRLSESDYDRTGDHPDLGEVTLRQLLATWVAHDLNHLGQIAEVMARQYKVEVGPWKEFLDILG